MKIEKRMVHQSRETLMLVPFVTSAMLLMLCSDIGAQQAGLPRLGYLLGPAGLERRTESFRQGLREIGYIEGTNIFIEYRYADGNFQQLSELVADLVPRKVQIIVTAGGQSPVPQGKQPPRSQL
jgi:ABC-type uncharacterized transport system substrate-binding protein